jgi:hypothetical protein
MGAFAHPIIVVNYSRSNLLSKRLSLRRLGNVQYDTFAFLGSMLLSLVDYPPRPRRYL